MDKVVIFAFNGNPMCFSHVLLNALDMAERGMDARIVIEGEAVTLLKGLEESNNPLYLKAKEKKLIDAICKACSAKLGVLDYNETLGLPIVGDMSGHPSMARYMEDEYTVITL